MRFAFAFFFFFYSTFSSAINVKVMSYNVENLFDTTHDQGKNDWEFLPKSKSKKENCKSVRINYYRRKCIKSNWTNLKLNNKLIQISKVIQAAGNPTFIALQEVENKKVLERLLTKLNGYKYAITNSEDSRGIDVALLFKQKSSFQLLNCNSIKPNSNIFKSKKTRDILHCSFKNKNKKLDIFVNHWPSLGNKNFYRMSMAKLLKDEIKKLPKESYIIAMGDFNTIESLHPHPFWNELMINSDLINLNRSFLKSKKIKTKFKKMMPLGSYFYHKKMQWNLLDHFFLSANFLEHKNNEMRLIIDSYKIFAPVFLQDDYLYYRNGYLKGSVVRRVPLKYNFRTKNLAQTGFSDHFPIVFSFEIH